MPNPRVSDINFPVARLIFIIASFLLAVLDMVFLYKALGSLMGLSNGFAMITAFLIATVANFNALMWGWESGRHSAPKTINRYSAAAFIFWVVIGIFYVAIRILNLLAELNADDSNQQSIILGNLLQIVLLGVLYVGTGLTISSSAREIWDEKASSCRKAKKNFMNMHEDVSEEIANIKSSIGKLSAYETNYSSLNRQRAKIESSIYKIEEATMADIVGKVIANNAEVSPKEARSVKEDVLSRRSKHGAI